MSLKAFHVVFILVSIALAGGVAGWSWAQVSDGAGAGTVALGLAAVAAAVGLLVYLVRFLKKMKDVSYL